MHAGRCGRRWGLANDAEPTQCPVGRLTPGGWTASSATPSRPASASSSARCRHACSTWSTVRRFAPGSEETLPSSASCREAPWSPCSAALREPSALATVSATRPRPAADPAPLDALSAPALSHAASLQDARAERRGLLAYVQGQAGEAARRDRAAGGLQVEDRLQPGRRAGFSGWGGGGATRRLDQRVHKGQPAGAALDGVTHLQLPARPGCVLYCTVR